MANTMTRTLGRSGIAVQQVEENAGAMQFGPLSPEQIQEIDTLLER